MRFSDYSFGSVRVDGVTYNHDLIIDRGKIRKCKKSASRKFRSAYGHTPLSAAEDIPWRCRRLVIGTGADGALPVMKEVHDEARRHEVHLVILPTAQAIGLLTAATKDTNAILHLTCNHPPRQDPVGKPPGRNRPEPPAMHHPRHERAFS